MEITYYCSLSCLASSLLGFSNFIHVVVWIITSMAEQHCIVWLIPLLPIHSSINGHLGYFYLVAIVNCAAMNICIQVFAQLSIFNSLG